MQTVGQVEHLTFRIIIFDRSGTQILVVSGKDKLLLPSVRVPQWQRLTESISAAVRDDWGREVICLFAPTTAAREQGEATVYYEVAQDYRRVRTISKAMWWQRASADLLDLLADRHDYEALRESMLMCKAAEEKGTAAPFAKIGWFEQLRDWVSSVIVPRGLRLNGNIRQLTASPSFALIRFETDGPAVWFKAAGEPNVREYAITLLLARLLPTYVPVVLGSVPHWNSWLCAEVEGVSLENTQQHADWQAAAAKLAELQISSTSYTSLILEAGAHDLRVSSLLRTTEPFFEVIIRLFSDQVKVSPPVLNRKQLLCLRDCVQDSLVALQDTGISDTLGHLDLNPGNIIVAHDKCTFLDWAEAYVGNPLLTLEYLLEHLRRKSGLISEFEGEITESYVLCWQWTEARDAVVLGRAYSPLVAVFAYAVASGIVTNEDRMRDPAARGYLRSLTRRMSREADRLSGARLWKA